MRCAPLSAAIALLLSLPVAAEPAEEKRGHADHHAEQAQARLQDVVVTASPLKQSAEELTRPIEVLTGPALDAARAATLGDTIERLPGVHTAGFGPGVGRPVIRGLDGARVQTLSGGLSSLDASTVSADHAVGIEPFLADQIEVLKGPATLLYGSGAIGGAVNVVDGRIPEFAPAEPGRISGRAELRGSTGNDEATGMVKLETGSERFALHLDALHRDAGDSEIPGYAESAALLAEEGEQPDPDLRGQLPNSALRTASGALGASWIGDRGFIGAALSQFDTVYGIPGHGHADEHAGDEPSGEAEDGVRIDLTQQRMDLRGSLLQPFAGHESLSLRAARSDYRHLELEGDEVGTRFDNQGVEARLEAVHAPLAGWNGAWGLQYGRRDFVAVGEEAFVPASIGRDVGAFVLEQRALGARWDLEIGARGDRVEVDPRDRGGRRFSALSSSAGLRWEASESLHVDFGFDHAERAPTSEELYSDGPHAATASYEVGDAALDTEHADRVELGAHWHVAGLQGKAALYATRFRDFIFLADTGLQQDQLPLRQWTQADARFHGWEIAATRTLTDGAAGRFDLRLSADAVRARLRQGGDLPRIPAQRVGAELQWQRDAWRASVGAVHTQRQDRVAEFERASPGYTLVDARVAYHFDVGAVGWEVFLDGRNLSDREARPHTSLLKEVAPLPGRSLGFGVRAWF